MTLRVISASARVAAMVRCAESSSFLVTEERAQHIQLGEDSHNVAAVVHHRKNVKVVAVEPGQQVGY